MEFAYSPGQTPIDPDEAAGLLPKHITTQAQLNAWEQANIFAGQKWGLLALKKRQVLEEAFVRDLHRRMFSKTWSWAGNFRNTDKTIGVPSEHVATRLHQLLGNVQWQVENKSAPPDELAIRFHRDLVWVHPFPNGNGRHARMMADLLAIQLGGERFTWGSNADLEATGQFRDQYIDALRRADQNDYGPLLAFARG